MCVVEQSFAGMLEAKGFEERLMRLGPAPEQPEEPGQFWKDFIRDTAPVFRESTLAQLGTFIAPTWQALLDGARHVDDRLVEIFEELAPDVIVEDNVVRVPGDPRRAADPGFRSGLVQPARAPGSGAAAGVFGVAGRRPSIRLAAHSAPNMRAGRSCEMHASCSDLLRRAGRAAAGRALEMIDASPRANLMLYPARARLPSQPTVAATEHNLETSVRATDEPWAPPGATGALVYVSLGSLGLADVAPMGRLIACPRADPVPLHRQQGPSA